MATDAPVMGVMKENATENWDFSGDDLGEVFAVLHSCCQSFCLISNMQIFGITYIQ